MNEENNELGPKAALWLASTWVPEYFESLPRAPPLVRENNLHHHQHNHRYHDYCHRRCALWY